MDDQSTAMSRVEPGGQLAAQVPSDDEFRRMSVYSDDGWAEQTGRLGELAVISAGTKVGDTPRASRPTDAVQIYLHDPYGRAPKLAEALAIGEYRRLTITFPDDNVRAFIRQRRMLRSRTRVQVYGDEAGNMFVIGTPVQNGDRWAIEPPREGERAPHKKITPESPEFEYFKRICKPEYRIYFNLAEWMPDKEDPGRFWPEVVFPDGLGVYAIRTTSGHTVDEITGYLNYLRVYTGGKMDEKGRVHGGRIAGIPLQLEVVYRDVPDNTGQRRTIPIFTVSTKPPKGMRLSGVEFRRIAEAGVQEAEGMRMLSRAINQPGMLPPPDEDPFEQSLSQIVEPDEASLAILSTGAPVDWRGFTASWHARTRGTKYDENLPNGREERRAWLERWSNSSLNEFEDIQRLTQADADRLIADLSEELARAARPRLAGQYDRIYGSAYDIDTRDRPATQEPVTVDVPPKPSVARVTQNSGLGQAFQADHARATELGIDRDTRRSYMVASWPADREEVEQKRSGLRKVIDDEIRRRQASAAAQPAPTEEPAQPVADAREDTPRVESGRSTAPAARRRGNDRSSEPSPPADPPPTEIWEGEVPAEYALEDKPAREDESAKEPASVAPSEQIPGFNF